MEIEFAFRKESSRLLASLGVRLPVSLSFIDVGVCLSCSTSIPVLTLR